eukprot:1447913-Amphidinium_carterae.1
MMRRLQSCRQSCRKVKLPERHRQLGPEAEDRQQLQSELAAAVFAQTSLHETAEKEQQRFQSQLEEVTHDRDAAAGEHQAHAEIVDLVLEMAALTEEAQATTRDLHELEQSSCALEERVLRHQALEHCSVEEIEELQLELASARSHEEAQFASEEELQRQKAEFQRVSQEHSTTARHAQEEYEQADLALRRSAEMNERSELKAKAELQSLEAQLKK